MPNALCHWASVPLSLAPTVKSQSCTEVALVAPQVRLADVPCEPVAPETASAAAVRCCGFQCSDGLAFVCLPESILG